MEAVSGPVGVVTVVEDAAKMGFATILYVVCVLTINLGVFNLLPIPALDGGTLLFLLIEMIFRKPIPRKVENALKLAFFGLLMLLVVFVTCKDILGIFA